MTDATLGVTRKALLDDGLGWLLEAAFFPSLRRDEQDRVLAELQWRDVPAGELLIARGVQGRGVDLIVSGHVVVLAPDEHGALVVTARQGPGHLLGERSLLRGTHTSAEVRATSPLRTLHLPAAAFRALILESERLLRYVTDLVDLRERAHELLETMLRNPFLRSLGRDDLDRLVESAQLVRHPGGTALVGAGERTRDVYVVIRGRVGVYAPARGKRKRRERLAVEGPGGLVGHAAVLLERPRSADVETLEDSELLRLSDATFMDIVLRNPLVQRRMMQTLATLDLSGAEDRRPGGLVVLVCGAEQRLGSTTLAYGVAAALQQVGPVVLVDLDGAASAARLGVQACPTLVGDVPALEGVTSWPLRLLWPASPGETARLIRALALPGPAGRIVVISGTLGTEAGDQALDEAEAVVWVRNARDDERDLPVRRGQLRVQAVRVQPTVALPLGASRKAGRVPDDLGSVHRFWRTGDLDLVGTDRTPLGAACGRLVRLLRGRSVGLALGGGGALGFAHIGLIRSLVAAGIPVDAVAGSSFGALVGAVYAARGLDGLDELVDRRAELLRNVLSAFMHTGPIERFVDRLTGGAELGTTPIPCYPVALDITKGREVAVTSGSLGFGVRASGSLPGVFPSLRHGYARLVDGGIVNNVPASIVWEAGADFILASNIIPSNPLGIIQQGPWRRALGRMDDLVRSMYFMMSQNGRDRAVLADYVFDLALEGYNVYDFHRGAEIAAAGREQATLQLPQIQGAYASDLSVQF